MSGSNSHKAAREKMVKTKSKENKRKRQMKYRIAKRPRLGTDFIIRNETVFTEPFRRLSTEKDMFILMLGLSAAGKSTILRKLGDNISKVFSEDKKLFVETFDYDNISTVAWDVGGQVETRQQWSHYFKNTKGLIFVVDSSDKSRIVEAKDQLHLLLNEELLKDVFLLVFANKKDRNGGMDEAEVTESLGLSSIEPIRRRVQFTCATKGEGLCEGLDWLSKKIQRTCATSGEGVNKGLDLIRNMRDTKEYFYRKYNDLPIGRFFNPSDEELIDFLVRLNNGNDISPDRVNRVNLFCNHPTIIIKSHYLHQYILDTRKYYLFYCKVPADAKYSLKGYHHFRDRAKGVWQTTRKSFIFHCNLLDKTTRYGERQRFRYKPVNETTSSWRMVMYGLPDFPHQQGLPNVPRPLSKKVILKVYESAKSKNAMAVKSLANLEKDVLETSNMFSANVAKIELLETALREEKMKRDTNWLGLGVKTHRLIRRVKKYSREEHKEVDEIMRRTRRICIAKAILKTRSKHTRD